MKNCNNNKKRKLLYILNPVEVKGAKSNTIYKKVLIYENELY